MYTHIYFSFFVIHVGLNFNHCLIMFFFSLSAVWGGAKLTDVLELVGIPKLTSITQFGGKHVEFVSVDKCKVMTVACLFVYSRDLGFFLVILIFIAFMESILMIPFNLETLQEENGGPYKASIPLNQATNPEADVLLAYEMNGEVSEFDFLLFAIFLQN